MKIIDVNRQDIQLSIIYEDDYIVVINKKDGLLSHCNKDDDNESVVKILKENNIQLFNNQDPFRDGIVHRLDKDTTGLMVLAKNKISYENLSMQFKKRKVVKKYKAFCWSIPIPIAGVINKPISDYLNRKKIKFNSIGKEAITEYKVLKNFKNFFSKIECQILTGRTHQIRVHMQSINCPLVGDQLYSRNRNAPDSFSKKFKVFLKNFKRQALHAQYLSFQHPIDKEEKSFFIDEPYDIINLENSLIEEFG